MTESKRQSGSAHRVTQARQAGEAPTSVLRCGRLSGRRPGGGSKGPEGRGGLSWWVFTSPGGWGDPRGSGQHTVCFRRSAGTGRLHGWRHARGRGSCPIRVLVAFTATLALPLPHPLPGTQLRVAVFPPVSASVSAGWRGSSLWSCPTKRPSGCLLGSQGPQNRAYHREDL